MLYFAYGMNTNSQGMAQRCPAAVSFGRAQLEGHQYRFAGPADVQVNRHSDVEGVLWDITEDCLAALDALEGYPYYYNRRYRDVFFAGRVVKALTYFMQPGNIDYPPSTGYFNMVKEGYLDHGVPLDQLYNAREACYYESR